MTAKFDLDRILFVLMAVGVWIIVLQNAGAIPTIQSVHVESGSLRANVSGSVDVDNTVRVSGDVDVNIDRINGRSTFYDFAGNGNFVRIPVYTGY